MKAGIKSTAVLFGSKIRSALIAFASIFLVCFAAAGYRDSQGVLFQAIGIGGSALYILMLLNSLDVEDWKSCQKVFMVSMYTGIEML